MKFHKIITLTLTVILLFATSCSKENSVKTNNNENNTSGNLITVTAEQFSASGMKLGKFTKQSFSENIRVSGMMDVPPEYKASVSVYYGGTVKNIHLLVGQKIKKGKTLFTLENPQYIEMQQNYLNAKANLKYLKSEYGRQKTLFNENISSEKKYLQAEANYLTALSEIEALEKKLKLINISPATLNVNSMTTEISVLSPVAGNISQVNITKGEYLTPNKIAVEIVGTEHIHLELNVFEKDIHKIKKGQTIKFSLPDGKNKIYYAEVFLVGKTVNGSDRTINIHGHLKNEKEKNRFIPGMYIQAEILVDAIKQFALPEDAIVNVDEEYFVLVEKSDKNNKHTFIKQPVSIGKSTNGFTEILNINDFKNDANIVVKGAFNLIN